MCGIVGMIGGTHPLSAVLDGLKRLEYRGYDSAGVALLTGTPSLTTIRATGRVADLEAKLPAESGSQAAVIGHTRWATHGAPLERNAHPHLSADGNIAIVHNGIIDNFESLRAELAACGVALHSDTDSEVIAHLIARAYQGSLVEAIEAIIPRLDGTFAIAALCKSEPGTMVGARRGSPLAAGLTEDAAILASDAVPILPYTRKVLFLEDDQIVVCRPGQLELRINGKPIDAHFTEIEWSAEDAQKGGYKHFMLKEIFEQPEVLTNLVRARIDMAREDRPDAAPVFRLDEIDLSAETLAGISRIVLLGQGTSFHAGMIGRNLIERTAHVPAYAEYSADFRYRDPILDPSVLVIALSQSGETMDTLHAVKLARQHGCTVISIVNAVGSSIARESDGVFYMNCGPEIGVASTKAFTAMIASLYILALRMGQSREVLSGDELRRRTLDLLRVGSRAEAVLSTAHYIRDIALRYQNADNALFLGRGTGWPLAMEGALKLKEVSYIHAEGYDAAEMKHGPIALIDENMPCLFIALKGRRYEKILGNIQEVKARQGRVIAIASHDDTQIHHLADDVIYIRAESGVMNSIVCALPLQLMSYYIADARGCDVDKPKNLAKSVTVE